MNLTTNPATLAHAIRRFPLLGRPRPACPSLPERVQEITDIAHAALHDGADQLADGAHALNKAALIASDCGLAELARDLCWQHIYLYRAAGHPLTVHQAQRLADYPILDDEDFSERERTNALKVLADSYDIPENIADDVLREIEDRGDSLCTDCNSWKDINEIMADLGYRQCQDCDEWIETRHEKALCYDCAESYTEGECECVPVMVEGYRHGGHTVTPTDVQETLRGCETCYPLLYPYGR